MMRQGKYSESGSQFKFKATVLMPNLFDYTDAYIFINRKEKKLLKQCKE